MGRPMALERRSGGEPEAQRFLSGRGPGQSALGYYLKDDLTAAAAESRQIANPFFPPGLMLDALIADRVGDRARNRTSPCSINSMRLGATNSGLVSAGFCQKARWPTVSLLPSRPPLRTLSNSDRWSRLRWPGNIFTVRLFLSSRT